MYYKYKQYGTEFREQASTTKYFFRFVPLQATEKDKKEESKEK
jgi:hypothetical protein